MEPTCSGIHLAAVSLLDARESTLRVQLNVPEVAPDVKIRRIADFDHRPRG